MADETPTTSALPFEIKGTGPGSDKPADLSAEVPKGYRRMVVLRAFPAEIEHGPEAKNYELMLANPANRIISPHRYDKRGHAVCQNVVILSDKRAEALSRALYHGDNSDTPEIRPALVRPFVKGQDDHLLTAMVARRVDRFAQMAQARAYRSGGEFVAAPAKAAAK